MKYTKEQNLELRKAVANFNKKRKRLEEKGVSPSLLPERATVSGLKRAYDNKRDLNNRLKQMASFTSAGGVRENKQGIQGTNDLFEYRQKEINKARTRISRQQVRLKKMDIKYKSVREDAELNLDAKKKFLQKDIEDVDLKTLQRINMNALTDEKLSKKNETYFENTFKMFYQMSEYSSFDKEKAKYIEEELRKLSPAQMIELTNTDSIVKSIIEAYEAMKQERKVRKKDIAKQLFNTDILKDTIDINRKIDSLYEALPSIKKKYGIE